MPKDLAANRPLRVLHLPVNIRWILDATIKGQERLGVETRKFLISKRGVDNPQEERFYWTPVRDPDLFLKGYPTFLLQTTIFLFNYWKALRWADVVHWQYSTRVWRDYGFLKNIDFRLIKRLNKPVIVQFHGTDFRDNQAWMEFNPWWEEGASEEQTAQYDEQARAAQKDFSEANFDFAMSFGMVHSVWPENVKRTHIMERAVDVSAYERRWSQIEKKARDDDRVVIVHGPSSPTRKGTQHILDAMDRIQQERDVDFRLMTDMTHEEVLDAMRDADIVIDQLISGDYGVFGVEAMASGSAVVCGISPEMRKAYPKGLPLIDANPDTIYETVLRLIDSPSDRETAAKKGIEYAKRVHSVENVAPEVLRVYREVAKSKGLRDTVARIDAHLKIARDKGWVGISEGNPNLVSAKRVWDITHPLAKEIDAC